MGALHHTCPLLCITVAEVGDYPHIDSSLPWAGNQAYKLNLMCDTNNKVTELKSLAVGVVRRFSIAWSSSPQIQGWRRLLVGLCEIPDRESANGGPFVTDRICHSFPCQCQGGDAEVKGTRQSSLKRDRVA